MTAGDWTFQHMLCGRTDERAYGLCFAAPILYY